MFIFEAPHIHDQFQLFYPIGELPAALIRYWIASVISLSLPFVGEESPDSVEHRTI